MKPGSMCRVAVAPCSPFSVTPELMRDSATLARNHNVRLHTHMAETVDERVDEPRAVEIGLQLDDLGCAVARGRAGGFDVLDVLPAAAV